MKRAKVSISKTVNGDMTYSLFRFKNQAPKMDVHDYENIEPIEILSERDSSLDEGVMMDVEVTMNDKGEGYDFITYSLPFEFIYRDNFFMFNLINEKGKVERKMEVYVNQFAIKEVLVKKLESGIYINEKIFKNPEEIAKVIIVESNCAIGVHRSVVEPYHKVTMNINTRKVPFIDKESHGVYKHSYKVVERLKDYELYPIKEYQENIYHYTTIGEDSIGRISEVSNIGTVRLSEDPNKVNTTIEYSDNYFKYSDTTWDKLESVKASNPYRIEKGEMYSRCIPQYEIHEVNADDTNLEVYNERLLRLPNVWHRDKLYMLYRKARAYRMQNELNGQKSEFSEVFYIDKDIKINLDKLVIYKKNVTYLNPEERKIPIQIADKDADLLKMYVRLGGLYYADAINSDNQPIEIVPDNSRIPLFQIKDHCLYSNYYNYTVYLYDEKGNRSEPCTIVL